MSDAFRRSPHGAFLRSPHGVRGGKSFACVWGIEPGGRVLWTLDFGTSNPAAYTPRAWDIGIDGAGYLYVSGTEAAYGGTLASLWKLDQAGNVIWHANPTPGGGAQYIDVSPDGDVYGASGAGSTYPWRVAASGSVVWVKTDTTTNDDIGFNGPTVAAAKAGGSLKLDPATGATIGSSPVVGHLRYIPGAGLLDANVAASKLYDENYSPLVTLPLFTAWERDAGGDFYGIEYPDYTRHQRRNAAGSVLWEVILPSFAISMWHDGASTLYTTLYPLVGYLGGLIGLNAATGAQTWTWGIGLELWAVCAVSPSLVVVAGTRTRNWPRSAA
jgi:hypothetical protein